MKNQKLRRELVRRQGGEPVIDISQKISTAVPIDDTTKIVDDGGYWLGTKSMKRHNSKCRYYKMGKGRPCRKDEGMITNAMVSAGATGDDGVVIFAQELRDRYVCYKREFASAQILEKFREMRKRYGERLTRMAVAGDFNTNEDDETFVSEATLRSFYGAHFRSCFKGLKKHQRVTHPKSGGYPDATFDYILYRGFGRGVARKINPGSPISDPLPSHSGIASTRRVS